MSAPVVFIDFDRTLNDADSVMGELLHGLLGLTGRQAVAAFMKAHDLVHTRYPERHDELRLTFQLLVEQYRDQAGNLSAAEVQHRFQEAWDSSWRSPQLFPDAIPFLRGLRDQGYRLFLATGDHAPQKAEHLERLAGESLLLGAFDPGSLGHTKGSRAYVERALELADAKPTTAWSVGDSLNNDVAPALEAGVRALWVNRDGQELRPRDPQPSRTARDLQEALAILSSSG